MNDQILSYINSLPKGQGYKWNVKVPTSGVTMDIIYQGETILKRDSTTFCSGVTFQSWFMVFGNQLTIPVDEMKRLQQDWYVATGKRAGPVDALVPRGLGAKVELNDAMPGDFLQLWRSSGSGHSVIYLSHTELSLTYWSTQPSTKGIGKRTENRTGANAVVEFHIVRAHLPIVTV